MIDLLTMAVTAPVAWAMGVVTAHVAQEIQRRRRLR